MICGVVGSKGKCRKKFRVQEQAKFIYESGINPSQ